MDRTYGSGQLIEIAQDHYQALSSTDKVMEMDLTEEFKLKMKDDWLLNMLCQYSDCRKEHYTFGDTLWYKHIKEMIINGTLYVTFIPVANYAFPDKDFEKNRLNLLPIGIDVTKEGKVHSDGIWYTDRPIELKKVYMTDETTPAADEMEKITIDAGYGGVAEFGTQKICKSAMTLKMGDCLLRVPYEINHLSYIPPLCAIFYNMPK